jgi:hypothetical protein
MYNLDTAEAASARARVDATPEAHQHAARAWSMAREALPVGAVWMQADDRARAHRLAAVILSPGWDASAPCEGCGDSQGMRAKAAPDLPGCNECTALGAALGLLTPAQYAAARAALDGVELEPTPAELAELAAELQELPEYGDGREVRSWCAFDGWDQDEAPRRRQKRNRDARRLCEGFRMMEL